MYRPGRYFSIEPVDIYDTLVSPETTCIETHGTLYHAERYMSKLTILCIMRTVHVETNDTLVSCL